MSWELASFLILGVVLVGGFAWYERSRPPSQVVALVAALAALAIAGRIAFAAFPNVKPTTDIVIFAGYALGGAPGFAVGALAALISNFWFGQGPWTPWQMVAWGLCGVLGAALALGARNAGRLTLAATCGFAGLAFGTLLNFSLMATYGGALSWRHFGVLEARAIPFEVAAVSGNVVFALIAGPAMIRMLVRFRERFVWERGGDPALPANSPGPASPGGPAPRLRAGGIAALLLVALTLGALGLGALAPDHANASGAGRAASWLRSVQNDDGGFGASVGEGSDPAMTGWAMLGLEAAGQNPLDIASHGHTPVDFLRGSVGELKSPGDLSRTILALEGAGIDPRRFGGINLVSRLLATRRGNGSFEGWPSTTAFGVIALRTAGATGGLGRSLSWLHKVQNDDGGWGDEPGLPSTTDDTGTVMQALSSGSKAAHRGLSYLRRAQRSGGGFPLGRNYAVNTQSTAWAIQGILAAGGKPGSFRRGGASAPGYLTAQQASDGHYRYSKSSNQTPIWVTGEVLVAAAGDYFPVPPPPREPKSAQSKPKTGATATNAGSSDSASTRASGSGSAAPGEPSQQVRLVLPSRRPAPGTGVADPSRTFCDPRTSPPLGHQPAPPHPGGERGRGSATPESEPSASETEEPSAGGSSSSPAAAILLGLLAGCLLFGAAWAGRRLWMRRRYGL